MKTFLEIGSCDFDTLNHLSDSGWSGVIVEPTSYINNIPKKENIQYVNSAISDYNGVGTMYSAREDVVERDSAFKGMTTLIPNSNWALTNEIEVDVITFERLFEITSLERIDYLKIDTEGYDAYILSLFPWNKVRPNYIKFESEHLSDEDMSSTIGMLKSLGYHCEIDDRNTYAIKL